MTISVIKRKKYVRRGTKGNPYSCRSLLSKRLNAFSVGRCMLAGFALPTLSLFSGQLSATRAFVASHEPQNTLLPNQRLRVGHSYDLYEQHICPGGANIFGESHDATSLSK